MRKKNNLCEECCEETADCECAECGAVWCEQCASDRDGVCCVQTIRKMETSSIISNKKDKIKEAKE